jgi:phenylalanyl-tRNA synthetase beta chain
VIGELHPKWTRAEGLQSAVVLFELDVRCLATLELAAPAPLSKQPVVQRDLALWVSADIPLQSILDTIHATIKANSQLAVVQDVRLFDVWRPKAAAISDAADAGQVSLALRFWLQDPTVTLEDERVDQCLSFIRQALEITHGARQR